MQNANTKKHDDEGLLPRKLDVKKPNYKSGLRSPTGENMMMTFLIRKLIVSYEDQYQWQWQRLQHETHHQGGRGSRTASKVTQLLTVASRLSSIHF